jgi:hypothetical protein
MAYDARGSAGVPGSDVWRITGKTRIMKALGAAGSAGALALLCLIDAGGAASASPSSVQPGPVVPVASLRVPGSFQLAAASFVSPAWGVVLGGSGCITSHACRAQLAVTTDGGAHWSPMRTPAIWLANGGSSRPQVSQVVVADRADGWLYNQDNSGLIWVTHNGGASWREITLPGNIQTMAASADAVYAVVGNQLYRSPSSHRRHGRSRDQRLLMPVAGRGSVALCHGRASKAGGHGGSGECQLGGRRARPGTGRLCASVRRG